MPEQHIDNLSISIQNRHTINQFFEHNCLNLLQRVIFRSIDFVFYKNGRYRIRQICLAYDSTLDITNSENALKLIFIKYKHKFCAMTIHLLQCRNNAIINANDFIFDFRYVVHIVISLELFLINLQVLYLKGYLLHDWQTR